MQKINIILIFSAIIVLLTIEQTFAYLDPATGSIIVQIIIGVVATSIFVLKGYWKRFLRFLGLGKKESTINSEDEIK